MAMVTEGNSPRALNAVKIVAAYVLESFRDGDRKVREVGILILGGLELRV